LQAPRFAIAFDLGSPLTFPKGACRTPEDPSRG
jgi:hypothetical protein